MIQATAKTAYDEVSYSSYAYAQTHPDRLATIATLFGMEPAAVNKCRVLELGCGAGGNIVPMALGLPESKFLGIDLAASAIRHGQEVLHALGLNNISLQQMDLMAVPDDVGKFDYIVAHGLFSWVPEVARDRILAICRNHLAPQGVAYISYNAYPGCRLREIARDIMRFHSKDTKDIADKVNQSRAVIKWIADAHKKPDSYSTYMSEMATRLIKRDVGSIYHDELADVNVPFYFYEFAKLAGEHGLQFLSEADFFEGSADSTLAEEAIRQLDQLGEENLLAKEQYLDFLKGRSFRQTLLCHYEVPIQRPIEPARLKGLLIKFQAQPVSPTPDIKSKSIEEFRAKNGAMATTDQPLAKAAFVYLSQVYPRAVNFEELLTKARMLAERSETNFDDDSATLASVILKTYSVGLIDLHLYEPAHAVEPGALPIASPLARLQIKEQNIVTTLFHNSLRLEDELAEQLLCLLDGTRDRHALVAELKRGVELSSNYDEAQKTALLANMSQQLDEKLNELTEFGLLLA